MKLCADGLMVNAVDPFQTCGQYRRFGKIGCADAAGDGLSWQCALQHCLQFVAKAADTVKNVVT